ncbi:hypothetical protein, partial [Micromonospora sp. NPDC004704]
MSSVRTLLHTGTILFLAAGLTVSATPASAVAAPPVQCGDTITRDVTLRADLRCTGDALVIGANGVTVDLNQHVISGPRTSGVGISATQRSGLRIRNGAIIDFAWGVTRRFLGFSATDLGCAGGAGGQAGCGDVRASSG